MKGIVQFIFVMVLFFMAATAVLQIDSRCKAMTSYGGDITASAEQVFNLGR